MVPQSAKHFAEQLNKALDDMGVPSGRERPTILGKMLHIPKQQAWSFLEGHVVPDENLLRQMASELDVSVDYLTGK